MTNKQYTQAREEAERADEVYTFVSYEGIYGRENRYMKPDDIKELRSEYKAIKADRKGFALEGFGNRALIIPVENGYILKSYYTDVAVVRNGEFYKLWDGYSNTTLKHINTFRQFVGMNSLSKREWIELEAI